MLPTIRADDMRFDPIQITPDDVTKCLRTFSTGSSGGPDGLTAKHLRDMISGATGETLKSAVTDFVNLLLRGDLPRNICEIIFGGRLIVLNKKDGGIRPIAVGYTLRRLAAKCAIDISIRNRAVQLKPIQLRVECQVVQEPQCTPPDDSS